MDVQTAITPMTSTQLLILWTLLGFLLVWMLLFALLAVRPEAKKKVELEDVPIYQTAQPTPHPVPRVLQTVASQSGNYVPATAGSMSGHESPVVLEQSQ